MSHSFKDLFSGHASDYSKYRPLYPKELFEYLSSLCARHDLAWDCGTGNGQAALEWTNYFQEVFATDPSEQQLTQAQLHQKIKYLKAAETCPQLLDQSVDLISVAQAFHWFNQQTFFQEARRVLRPQGLVAIWGYGIAHISPEIDAVTDNLYRKTLDGCWEKERQMIDDHYRRIYFPVQEIGTPSFSMKAQWTRENWVGYLNTWSAVKTYVKKNSVNPTNSIYDGVWKPNETKQIEWPLFLRVGKFS